MEVLSLVFKLRNRTLLFLSLQFVHAVFYTCCLLLYPQKKSRWKFHSMAYPDPVDALVAIPWPSPFPLTIKSEIGTTSRLL